MGVPGEDWGSDGDLGVLGWGPIRGLGVPGEGWGSDGDLGVLEGWVGGPIGVLGALGEV